MILTRFRGKDQGSEQAFGESPARAHTTKRLAEGNGVIFRGSRSGRFIDPVPKLEVYLVNAQP